MSLGLIDRGCIEFCCVGPDAERLHEDLDELIERKGLFEIVTTSETNPSDACEYILFAGGARRVSVLALTASRAEFTSMLRAAARSGAG